VNHVTNEEILQSAAAFTLRDDVFFSLVNSTSTNLYELLHLLGHRAFKSPAQQAACVAVTNGGTVSFRTATGGVGRPDSKRSFFRTSFLGLISFLIHLNVVGKGQIAQNMMKIGPRGQQIRENV